MNKLPVEVLEKIFQPLHQRDKAECTIVCRSWKEAIENTVLFTTVRLHSKGQFEKVIASTRMEPQKNDKVERLLIEIENMESSEIDMLSFLFPSIREITLYHKIDNQSLRFTKLLSPHPWRRTIKVIRETLCNLFTKQILGGDTCPNLTEIQVNGGKETSTEELIKLLVNAPNLKILALWHYNFSLMELEALHGHVPLLQSLSLHNSKVNSDILPEEIKPAGCMESLTLKNITASTTERFIDFEKYLTHKYPRLSHLAYKVYVDLDYDRVACMNRGLALQIQQIGPYLTSLEYLNNNTFRFIFPMLDRSGCQIKKVSIEKELGESEFQQIVESKQAHFIQSMSLKHILYSTITNNFAKLRALCELKLSFGPDGAGVSLSDLMGDIGGNLETFELCFAAIELSTLFIPSCPKLKNLVFKNNILPSGTDFFISKAFPNVRKLILDNCTWKSSTFYVDGLKLSYLEIRLALGDNHLLMITLHNNEKRWYTGNKVSKCNRYPISDARNCPAVRSLPFDKFDGLPFITFLCHSIHNFFLVNTIP